MRRLIKRLIHRLGYDLTKTDCRFVDGFDDQAKLLSGRAQVIFDVGAHIGRTVATYRELFPGATVWPFEPFDESFQTISRRFAGDPKVRPQQLAVAEAPSTRRFFVNSESNTNSLLPAAPETGYYIRGVNLTENRRTIEVQVTTLDRFCADNNIPRIDVLKLDVQGAELLALRGAADLLRRKAISIIYAEAQFADQYQNQVWFCELWKFLREAGYDLFGLYDTWRGPGGYLYFADALFLPRRTIPAGTGITLVPLSAVPPDA